MFQSIYNENPLSLNSNKLNLPIENDEGFRLELNPIQPDSDSNKI